MAMIAAEVLGLRVQDVRPRVADTDSIGQTDVTGGSRVTMATGLAVYEAAHDAVRQMKERAAKLWQIKPEDVDYVDGKVVSRNNGVAPLTSRNWRRNSCAPAARQRTGQRQRRRASDPRSPACWWISRSIPKPARSRSCAARSRRTPARRFIRATSKVRCRAERRRVWAGRSTRNTSTTTRALCVTPAFWTTACRPAWICRRSRPASSRYPIRGHPLGIRGVGEVSIVPPPAAVANALYRATGVRMTELPDVAAARAQGDPGGEESEVSLTHSRLRKKGFPPPAPSLLSLPGGEKM